MTTKHPGYSYRKFCERLIEAGAVVHSFADFHFEKTEAFPFDIDWGQRRGKKSVILRHDVDHDPEIARNMAKVEKENGIKSTYFALTSDTLMVWWTNKENRKRMIGLYQEIQEMGHEVGLHYDFLGDYFALNKDPEEKAREVLSFFRENGLRISGCASHGSGIVRSMVSAYGNIPSPQDFVNYAVWQETGEEKELQINSRTLKVPCMSLADQGLRYEAYFVRKAWYLSDSGRNFWAGGRYNNGVFKDLLDYDKEPSSIVKNHMKDGEVMQILVHPIWWKQNLRYLVDRKRKTDMTDILDVNIGGGETARSFYEGNKAYHCHGGPVRPLQLKCAVLKIPDSVEDYISKMKKVRGSDPLRKARKAKRAGYYCEEFVFQNHIPDIYEINVSAKHRQGREMSAPYRRSVEELGGIPETYRELTQPQDPTDYVKMFGIFILEPGHKQGKLTVDRRLCGYITLHRMGELALYSQLLGHAELLKDGIMYRLHEFIVESITKQTGEIFRGIKYLMSGSICSVTEGLKMWKKWNLFEPYYLNPKFNGK